MASKTTNGTTPPIKVLLIKNYPSATPADHLMVQSFRAHIARTAEGADATLDICCVANGDALPDPEALARYRLVVLSGGTVNLIAADQAEVPAWALQVLDMVRGLAAAAGAGAGAGVGPPKLLGICWGHQAIHFALGGELAWVEQGALVGVQNVKLTPEGRNMFTKESLRLHKFHVRYVKTLAPVFAPLAEHNEIALSHSGNILTFQGHPELTSEISRMLSGRGDTTYRPAPPSAEKAGGKGIVVEDAGTPHDGELAWKYIMEWALA